jgi:hypothetical protein
MGEVIRIRTFDPPQILKNLVYIKQELEKFLPKTLDKPMKDIQEAIDFIEFCLKKEESANIMARTMIHLAENNIKIIKEFL